MMSTSSFCISGIALLCSAGIAGCTHIVKVDPIEVKPIDITLHIYLEADQKLDDFFIATMCRNSHCIAPSRPMAFFYACTCV